MNIDPFIEDGLKILAVFAIVLMNAFFVAAELALVRIRDTQLDTLVAKGNRRAKVARNILANIDAYIGATQFGITLASLALGVVVEPVFKHLLQPLYSVLNVQSEQARSTIAIGVGFFVNSYLLIVVGELAPKAVAIRKTLPTALRVATPLLWFYRFSYPFIWVLSHSAQWLLRRMGIEAAMEGAGAHSEEELRLLLSSSRKISSTGTFSRDLVLNALDLKQRTAREVMRPRQEITPLDTRANMAECVELAERTRYSRFPLCDGGDLDKTRGVVHIKDLYAMRTKARTGADLLSVAKKLIYVPETARLERLLQIFLERKLHLAIVVDEFGGTLGLISLENILEELVGQIQDEFDQEKPLLVSAGDSAWQADGLLPLRELEELVGEKIPDEDVTTVSGWVTQKLGGFPRAGDLLNVGQFEVRVLETDGMRVSKLKITKRAPVNAEASPEI